MTDKSKDEIDAGTPGKVSDLKDIPAVRDYLNRVGAVPRGMTTAVVREQQGRYFSDIATLRLDKLKGAIKVRPGAGPLPENIEPNELEASLIAASVSGVKWPMVQPLMRLIKLPPKLRDAAADDIFEMRDASGQILMVQLRVEKEGVRDSLPFTYWDDEQWRICEPDGLLPLYGMDKLDNNTTVFIHEGAKAARAMQHMVGRGTPADKEKLKAHPWGNELSSGAHVGWIGGALAAGRSDWSALAKAGVTHVYIVNDNDAVGRRAVPVISKALSRWEMTVENICVTPDKFPVGWDLADPMPTNSDGEYVGEAMLRYAVPATWLTRQLPADGPGRPGRPGYALRAIATNLIVPIRELGSFGFARNGSVRQEDQLQREQAPYSDVQNCANLFWRDNTHGSVAGLTYRPDTDERIVQEGDHRNFNTYTRSPLVSEKADLTPWHKYLEYMVPGEKDRAHLERWIATLVGRPAVRMAHSLLLISTRQGKGKSTLLDQVLRPAVGMSNSALVTSKAMKSGFNGWAAGRRLVVCHEIYEGRNRALAESLKSILTDERVSINEKYAREYELPNWTMVAACSNSRRAIHLDNADRRWFIPDIDEIKDAGYASD